MDITPPFPARAVATSDELRAIQAVIRRVGYVGAARALGVDRHTLDRIRGRLPVRYSTMFLLRASLAQLPATEPTP